MSDAGLKADLVAVVADKDMEFAMRGILSRRRALQIREVTVDIFSHPEHDPGCYLRAHTFLASMVKRYAKAIVLFDREGCGAEHKGREQLEIEVESKLADSGWAGRSKVVVVDPELEIWVWSNSPHVAEILGWKEQHAALPRWLCERQLWRGGEIKPRVPKAAMEVVLRHAGLPRSASRYRQLAEKVSLERCQDAAFLKLKQTLREWFV